MKNTIILITTLISSFFSWGQNYLIDGTFTLNEPRILVFNKDNRILHDSISKVFNLQSYINQKDTVKITGMISYSESKERYYLMKLSQSQKILCFKKSIGATNIEVFSIKNDLSWVLETMKFEYLVSLLYFQEIKNPKLESLKKKSRATYGGINISKLKNHLENEIADYKEFLY